MVKRRILIERLTNGFIRAKLQRRQLLYWKVQVRQVIPPEQADKLNPDSTISLLLNVWHKSYGLTFKDTIDTRFEYRGLSLPAAALLELKLGMHQAIFRRKLKKARAKAIFSYLSSGVDRHTRGRFYVVQDSDGEPIVVNAKHISALKSQRKISRHASHLDFEKEALFSAHNLRDTALAQEPAYKTFYKNSK